VMRSIVLSFSAVFVLSGCDVLGESGVNITSVFASSDETSTLENVQGENALLCTALQYDGMHHDCTLTLNDGRQLIFDFTADARADEWGERISLLDISVIEAEAGVVQTFSESVGDTFNYPELADIDNDGDQELLIPTYTGNVNTTWRIWQQGVDGFQFAGEVNGWGMAFDEDTGLSTISSRGSAVTYYQEAYKLEEGGFVGVYTLMTDMHVRDCTLDQGPGFADSGLDADDILVECQAEMGMQ